MICDDNKFIFIHISKTAGTSIERTLAPDILLDDVMSDYGNTKFEGKHWSAVKYRQSYPEKFDGYFKFSFVRNPWDRLVSNYNWRKKFHGDDSSFDDWLDCFKMKSNCFRWCYKRMLADNDGKVIVDFIGRFERLQDDFDIVCDKIGVDRVGLGHFNNLSDRPHYSAYYSNTAREMVGDIFSWEIEKFGYRFENDFTKA